jgi:hypothetical protein
MAPEALGFDDDDEVVNDAPIVGNKRTSIQISN